MCGIVGSLSFKNGSFEITNDYITRMRDTMVHRGPDGAGTYVSNDHKIGLGHRRLSIIDLSESAAQPMCNANKTLWITYNGEIYNHAEIRKELEALNKYQWKTDHSDTEVILHAFAEWGIECVHKFRGMFAFAIWDQSKRELWLMRDRIGIKPLYYSVHNGRITFASEIKALLQDPQQKRAVNEEGLFHYLSFLTTPAPQTLFDGIYKLPPATWMRINEHGDIRQERYWDALKNRTILNTTDEGEIATQILDELRKAVKLRKVSDVPVGVFLSGGIDSSTNAALFSEGEQNPIKTFSIGYDQDYGSYKNELQYARLMAKTIHSDHHEKILNVDDLINFLPQMVHLQDEPIADPVCVPVYYVSKLARDNGVTVCQVGEGADELFWGYPNWKILLNLQRYNNWPVPNVLKKTGLSLLNATGNKFGFPYEFLRRGCLDQPIFWGGAEAFPHELKISILSDRLKTKFKNYSSWEAIKPIRKRYEEQAKDPNSVLDWMTYLDLNFRLPELLLMRVDKMSMGVSLEGRVPFLDHKFVELAMGIPESIKTKNQTLKHILKKSVRGVIPDELIDRKKQGFGVPIREWAPTQLGQQMQTEIQPFTKQTDFFNNAGINKLFESNSFKNTWNIYNFAMWNNQYIANSKAEPKIIASHVN